MEMTSLISLIFIFVTVFAMVVSTIGHDFTTVLTASSPSTLIVHAPSSSSSSSSQSKIHSFVDPIVESSQSRIIMESTKQSIVYVSSAAAVAATGIVALHSSPTSETASMLASSNGSTPRKSTPILPDMNDTDVIAATTTEFHLMSMDTTKSEIFDIFRSRLVVPGSHKLTDFSADIILNNISRSSAFITSPRMVKTNILQMDELKRQQKSLNNLVSDDDEKRPAAVNVLNSQARATSSITTVTVTGLIVIIFGTLFILTALAIFYRRYRNRRCGTVYLSNNCSIENTSGNLSSRSKGGLGAEDGTGIGRPVLLPEEIEAIEVNRTKSVRVRRAIVLDSDIN